MPIKIPDTLPARDILVAEGVSVLTETDAIRQDIRPLRMPACSGPACCK